MAGSTSRHQGRHLIVRGGQALLSPGPLVSRHRPAVDVMFASAAEWVAAGTVAVVLSGALDDGAVGAALVAQAGGRVLVQDPNSPAGLAPRWPLRQALGPFRYGGLPRRSASMWRLRADAIAIQGHSRQEWMLTWTWSTAMILLSFARTSHG